MHKATVDDIKNNLQTCAVVDDENVHLGQQTAEYRHANAIKYVKLQSSRCSVILKEDLSAKCYRIAYTTFLNLGSRFLEGRVAHRIWSVMTAPTRISTVHSMWWLCAIYSLVIFVGACMLDGADTGECTEPTDFDLLLPFCKAVVPYRACLPRYQSLWYNHSALAKDRFVQQMFTKLVTQRKIYETNTTMSDDDTDEWSGSRAITPRFTDNPDCENAFRNYFCWLNFPRCDSEGRSLLLCRSVCENFMTACQYSSDLWRCGDPKYVNAHSAEISTTWVDQKLVYYRAPYPGSPFKDNVVDPDTDKPLVVCTPSLENSSRSLHAHSSQLVLALFAAAVWCILQ